MPDFPDPAAFANARVAAPEASPIQGPVHDPETGEVTHFGLHSTQVVHHGGKIVRLTHGESFIAAKDGEPAMLMRNRPTVAGV